MRTTLTEFLLNDSKRPYYPGRSLDPEAVARGQDYTQRSRIFPAEKSILYRNYALSLYDVLGALPVLSTLLGKGECEKVIEAVAAKVSAPEPIQSAADLERETQRLAAVLKDVKDEIKKQLKSRKVKFKEGSLLDFALMARQREHYFNPDFTGHPETATLTSAKQLAALCLTQDIVFDKVNELGKTELLKQRQNPFNPIVTYTEISKIPKAHTKKASTADSQNANEDKKNTLLVEQCSAFSKENVLSDEQVDEYLALVEGDGIFWGNDVDLSGETGRLAFVSYYGPNKSKLPEWFTRLERDQQRYIIIELLQAKRSDSDFREFIRASYSWQGSTFRVTPGRKNAFLNETALYDKREGESWELITDAFSGVPNRGSVPLLKNLKQSRGELRRIAAQNLRQDMLIRAEAFNEYLIKLTGNTEYLSALGDDDIRLLVGRPLSSLLSGGDSEAKAAILPCLRYGNNNGLMTEIYHEAIEENNILDNSVTLENGKKASLLFGLDTKPLNKARKSAGGYSPSALLSSILLLNSDYEASGITAVLSTLVFELMVAAKSTQHDPSLQKFALALLPSIQKLQRRTDVKDTSLAEINKLTALIQSQLRDILNADSPRAETLEFAHRFMTLAAYLRSTTTALKHDPEKPPEQTAAGLYQSILPPCLQDGGCKSAKDREAVRATTKIALAVYFAIYGKYPEDFDYEGGFFSSIRRLFASRSERSQHFREIFAELFLNGHHAAAHSLTASNFGLKSLEGVLSNEQKEALAEVGITKEVIESIQTVADSTGLKKIQPKSSWEKLCACYKADSTRVEVSVDLEDDEGDAFESGDSGADVAASNVVKKSDVKKDLSSLYSGADSRSESGSEDLSDTSSEPSDGGRFHSIDGSVYSVNNSLDAAPAPVISLRGRQPDFQAVVQDELQEKIKTSDEKLRDTPLREAMTLLLSHLLYPENNRSQFFSWSNFKTAMWFFAFGSMMKHQIEHGGLVLQWPCGSDELSCRVADWASPVVVHFGQLTLRGDWRLALGSGSSFAGFTYLALCALSTQQIMKRFAADSNARKPLSAEAKSLVASVSRDELLKLAQQFGLADVPFSYDGASIVAQAAPYKYALWTAMTALYMAAMMLGVEGFMSGVLDVMGTHETSHSEATVYSNFTGMALAACWFMFSARELTHLTHQDHEHKATLAAWLIKSGFVSSSDAGLLVFKEPLVAPVESRSLLDSAVRFFGSFGRSFASSDGDQAGLLDVEGEPEPDLERGDGKRSDGGPADRTFSILPRGVQRV